MAKLTMIMPKDMLEPEGEHEEKDPIHQMEVEDGFHTLMKAHHIRNNPKLMGKIRDHATKQKHAINHITSIADLKKRYNNSDADGVPEPDADDMKP